MSKVVHKLISKYLLSVLLAFTLSIATNANSLIPNSTVGANDSYLISSIETVDNCAAYFEGTSQVANCRKGEVPSQAAKWLFLIALITFVRLSIKRKI